MLLILDTSLADASLVALSDEEGGRILGQRVYQRSAGGSSLLLVGARELLEEQDADFEALTGIVVDRGPGSYTGLKVGFGLAQGMAETRGLPAVAVPSFEALALQHRRGDAALAVCYDARSRGIALVVWPMGAEQPLRATAPGAGSARAAAVLDRLELGEARTLVTITPAGAVPAVLPRPCRLVGPGVRALLEHLADDLPDDLEALPAAERPQASWLARLGALQLQTGGHDLVRLEPFYLGGVAPPPAGR